MKGRYNPGLYFITLQEKLLDKIGSRKMNDWSSFFCTGWQVWIYKIIVLAFSYLNNMMCCGNLIKSPYLNQFLGFLTRYDAKTKYRNSNSNFCLFYWDFLWWLFLIFDFRQHVQQESWSGRPYSIFSSGFSLLAHRGFSPIRLWISKLQV